MPELTMRLSIHCATPSAYEAVLSGSDLVLDLVLNQDRVHLEVLGSTLQSLVGKVSAKNLCHAIGRSEKFGGKGAFSSLGILRRSSSGYEPQPPSLS
ncbi:MAG: hypothetical protein QM650_12165 [Microlunatus sp.]